MDYHFAPKAELKSIDKNYIAGNNGFAWVSWDGDGAIYHARILIATDTVPERERAHLIREELTQALGLLTDIRNSHYETISVFSEDSNIVRKLGEQDRMAIRRHYPPN